MRRSGATAAGSTGAGVGSTTGAEVCACWSGRTGCSTTGVSSLGWSSEADPLVSPIRGSTPRDTTRARAAASRSSVSMRVRAVRATAAVGPCAYGGPDPARVSASSSAGGALWGPASGGDDGGAARRPGGVPTCCSARIASSKVRPCAFRNAAAMLRSSPTIAASTMAPSMRGRRPCLAASVAYLRICVRPGEIPGSEVPPPGNRSIWEPIWPETSCRNRSRSIRQDCSTRAASSSSVSASKRCSRWTWVWLCWLA